MRLQAAGLLAMVALAAAAGVWYPAVTAPVRSAALPGQPATTDARTFAAVVERLRAGEAYYDAMGAELRRHHYPTRDPFNWRTPLHLAVTSWAPWAVWRALLTAIYAALYAAMMISVRTRVAAWAASVLMLGILVICAAPDAVFVSEAWAGALIGLSLCAFGMGRWLAAVGLGLGALFVRELAAPYCVVCTLLALRDRKWREIAAWLVGAVAYAAYYGWHVMQVAAHRLPSDFAHGESWLTLLGLPFLQATLLKLGWFALLPASLSTLALATLVAGLLSPGTPRHLRATSATYVLFFLVAGFPFNDYWGFLAAPLWAITCGYGAGAIAAAVHTLRHVPSDVP